MAGALTANAVSAAVLGTTLADSPKVVATIEFLSPVDGANNVLLTAVFVITEGDETSDITAQWYRCQTGASVNLATLGDAVGDPFVFTLADTELDAGPYVVQAIDRGPAPASAYALAVESAEEVGIFSEFAYVDAVLYD